MSQLNFDINKLIQPKTQADYEALLDEALLVADDIQASLSNLFEAAEALQAA